MTTLTNVGMPVEIGRIDRELGRLWEESDDSKTRASLMNLAIYTEDAEAISANTARISEIADAHACRAILIFVNFSAPESRARAWIDAHCHVAGGGFAAGKHERQICSEQITFQLDGEMAAAMPNIVFSHLDSDLPLYFWRQGEFRKPLNEKLWSRVDRLIYDSSDWRDPEDQFQIVQEIDNFTETHTTLCDLNWTRLLGSRFALAQLFDHSGVLAHIADIRKVTIASSQHLTGLLLLGWLAAQLGWKHQSLLGRDSFLSADGIPITFEIKETPGEAISDCTFSNDDVTFGITRETGCSYYNAQISGRKMSAAPMRIPAGKSKLTDILLMELGRGGRHPLYGKALAVIKPLL
jgi:glucose-6-phosphate dehydrogenase assembly protein OpcA